jgi:hypothetical protein
MNADFIPRKQPSRIIHDQRAITAPPAGPPKRRGALALDDHGDLLERRRDQAIGLSPEVIFSDLATGDQISPR